MPDADQVVIFSKRLFHGFGLPTSHFFYDLLHYYENEHVHLNANSILHIPTFSPLCFLSRCQ
jgi:hypothetical protein